MQYRVSIPVHNSTQPFQLTSRTSITDESRLSIGVPPAILALPLLRPDGARVRAVRWTPVSIFSSPSSSSPSSIVSSDGYGGGGFSASSSSSGSTGRVQRATAPLPSTHCNVVGPISRRCLLNRHRIAPRFPKLAREVLRLELSTLSRALDRLAESSSSRLVGLVGRTPSIFGSEGRSSGSMYRESRSSPRGSGAFAGSQASFSVERSNRASMERCAAENSVEGAKEDCSELIGTS